MYTSYFYPAGATQANIGTDVVKLLAGTTDITQLAAATKTDYAAITFASGVGSGFSGLTAGALVGQYVHQGGAQRGIIVANTTTTVTISDLTFNAASSMVTISPCNIWTSWMPGGWTVYDAAAGANAQCLRAPINDDGTKYAYMVIDTDTAGYIFTKGYEDWNASTHTGTNKCYNSDAINSNQRLNTGAGGRLEISSCANHARFFSFQGSAYGNANGAPSGIFQRSRRSPWDTVANGYPPFAFIDFSVLTTSAIVFSPRLINSTGVDVTGSNAASMLATPFGSNVFSGGFYSYYPSVTVPGDAAKGLKHIFLPINIVYGVNGFMGGDISALSGMWVTTYYYGSAFDEVANDGNTYVIWTTGGIRWAVRKG